MRSSAFLWRQHQSHAENGINQFPRQHDQLICQARRQIDDTFIFGIVAPAMVGIKHSPFLSRPTDRMFQTLKHELSIIAAIAMCAQSRSRG